MAACHTRVRASSALERPGARPAGRTGTRGQVVSVLDRCRGVGDPGAVGVPIADGRAAEVAVAGGAGSARRVATGQVGREQLWRGVAVDVAGRLGELLQ